MRRLFDQAGKEHTTAAWIAHANIRKSILAEKYGPLVSGKGGAR